MQMRLEPQVCNLFFLFFYFILCFLTNQIYFRCFNLTYRVPVPSRLRECRNRAQMTTNVIWAIGGFF